MRPEDGTESPDYLASPNRNVAAAAAVTSASAARSSAPDNICQRQAGAESSIQESASQPVCARSLSWCARLCVSSTSQFRLESDVPTYGRIRRSRKSMGRIECKRRCLLDSAGEEGERKSENCSSRGEETVVPLETSPVQCGEGLARQCWDTGTYSSSLRQPEPERLQGVYPTGDTSWLEMANNGRGYGNSNVMLVRNESSTDMSVIAMLASCSPVALQVQRGGGSLEDAVVNCGQKRSYYPMFEASGEDPGEEDLGDDCTQQVEKKRRLTFDQVRALEKNFEIENKLEPERKMQLAKELGLQPRQVAVWFQNRRARWKIKQLERDYEVLSSDFNRLKSDYNTVLQEKEELESERTYLTERMQRAQPEAPGLPEIYPKESEKSSQLAPQETCEGSVKTETIAEPDVSKDGGKKKGSKETSSDSISSELLNADSPRTSMDSGSLLPLDNVIVAYPHIEDSDNIIQMSDHLSEPLLSQLQTCQRISVKIEDDSFQDDSCNYMLVQLDEEKGLPWWDWP